jgi:uncharacterized SAM-binding protein YcdF (DUF218 family)
MTKLQRLFLVTGAFCLLCGLVPVFYGVFNVGNYVLLGIGTVFPALAWLWPRLGRHRLVRRLLAAGVWGGVLVIAGISCVIAWRAWLCGPPEAGRQTVIVLGARVYSNGPSRMLRYRLDKALDYLEHNPEAVCIVTGGQGSDEPRTEASAMAEYLTDQGIPANRILLEEASTNTDENIRFSLPLIPAGSEGVVIVTNDFHQLRASMIAGSHGLNTASLSCFTPPGLLPAYWMREVGGVGLVWLMGILE